MVLYINLPLKKVFTLFPQVLNYYKRELVQVYGLNVLLKISTLEKAGILYSQSESRAYAVLRKVSNKIFLKHTSSIIFLNLFLDA